jgi:hypothetical protein
MLKLLIASVFAACAFGSAINSGSEAAQLVMETMLTDLSNKEVRSLDHFLQQGEIMGAWSYPGIVVPFDGYLVLVDDYALANWCHPCRWVFVSPDGETEVVRTVIPPDALPRMNVEYTSLPQTDDGKGQYEDFLAWFTPNVQSTSGNACSRRSRAVNRACPVVDVLVVLGISGSCPAGFAAVGGAGEGPGLCGARMNHFSEESA